MFQLSFKGTVTVTIMAEPLWPTGVWSIEYELACCAMCFTSPQLDLIMLLQNMEGLCVRSKHRQRSLKATDAVPTSLAVRQGSRGRQPGGSGKAQHIGALVVQEAEGAFSNRKGC